MKARLLHEVRRGGKDLTTRVGVGASPGLRRHRDGNAHKLGTAAFNCYTTCATLRHTPRYTAGLDCLARTWPTSCRETVDQGPRGSAGPESTFLLGRDHRHTEERILHIGQLAWVTTIYRTA